MLDFTARIWGKGIDGELAHAIHTPCVRERGALVQTGNSCLSTATSRIKIVVRGSAVHGRRVTRDFELNRKQSSGTRTSSTKPTAWSNTPEYAIIVRRYRISSEDPSLAPRGHAESEAEQSKARESALKKIVGVNSRAWGMGSRGCTADEYNAYSSESPVLPMPRGAKKTHALSGHKHLGDRAGQCARTRLIPHVDESSDNWI